MIVILISRYFHSLPPSPSFLLLTESVSWRINKLICVYISQMCVWQNHQVNVSHTISFLGQHLRSFFAPLSYNGLETDVVWTGRRKGDEGWLRCCSAVTQAITRAALSNALKSLLTSYTSKSAPLQRDLTVKGLWVIKFIKFYQFSRTSGLPFPVYFPYYQDLP